MPAPAVYVLAIVGTVGAVLAFKEFVYEPHIAPAIDRWKHEYLAKREARRRGQAMEVSQDGSDYDLLMSETRKKSKGKPSDKYSDDDDSDDEPLGKKAATTGTSHSFMRDGLLLRRPPLAAKNQMDVELDNLVAHEVNQWRSEVPDQVLRQRKNVSEHAMDESVQAIPYIPLAPSRTTHVVFDASSPSPSPPSAHIRLSSPPPPQLASPPSTGVTPTGPSFMSKSEMTSPPVNLPQEPADPTAPTAEATSLHSPVASPVQPAMPSPPEVTPFQHMATQSTLLGNTSHLPPTFNVPSTIPAQSLQQSYHQIIPSLSQSYPQDLDYEHDLELLSPPSSRADSPFSLAALSPDQRHSSRTLSALSSAISSPSPLRMDLGNQSYDAISPLPQIHLLAPQDTASTTHSAESTAYLSFADDSSDSSDDGMHDEPYPNPGASGPASARAGAAAQQQLHYHQPAALHPSLIHGPYHPGASPPHTSRLLGPATAVAPERGSAPAVGRAREDAAVHPEGLGLVLFSAPGRGPWTQAEAEAAASYTASYIANARSRDASYVRASPFVSSPISTSASAAGSPSAAASSYTSTPASVSATGSPAITASSYLTAAQDSSSSSANGASGALHSDGASDVSDLDFMSDYQPSEMSSAVSDFGAASDGSWSAEMADGAGAEDQGWSVERAAQGGRVWRA